MIEKATEVEIFLNKSETKSESSEKEQITSAIGNFGQWQLHKCAFIILVIWAPATFHILKMVFYR